MYVYLSDFGLSESIIMRTTLIGLMKSESE